MIGFIAQDNSLTESIELHGSHVLRSYHCSFEKMDLNHLIRT